MHLQREALQQRQAELHSVDQRISELQERLNRRKSSNIMLQRISNDQNDNALIFYNNNNPIYQMQNKGNYMKSVYPQKRGNIVAVEPFNHIPTKLAHNQDTISNANELSNINKHKFEQDNNTFVLKDNMLGLNYVNSTQRDAQLEVNGLKTDKTDQTNNVVQMQGKKFNNNQDILSEALITTNTSKDEQILHHIRNNNKLQKTESDQDSKDITEKSNLTENIKSDTQVQFKHKFMHVIPSGNLLTPPRKPISSVAPSSFTSSVSNLSGSFPKVHVVSPSVSQLSNAATEKQCPALPPKPSKCVDGSKRDQFINNVGTLNITSTDPQPIKAKPLTIKKQPVSEQPKLKFTSNKQPSVTIQQNDNQTQSQIDVKNIELPSVIDDSSQYESNDEPDKSVSSKGNDTSERIETNIRRKRALANENMKIKLARRVSFDPLGISN